MHRRTDETVHATAYGDGEALQPSAHQSHKHDQLCLDHHQRLQDRYRGAVEHHALLEKFYSVLMNHQYCLQEQNQVLEDDHSGSCREDACMRQDDVQTWRELLHVMKNLSPHLTQQGVNHEAAQVHG
jgi:hypothetical protein